MPDSRSYTGRQASEQAKLAPGIPESPVPSRDGLVGGSTSTLLETAARDIVHEINRCIQLGEVPQLRQIRWWGGHLQCALDAFGRNDDQEEARGALPDLERHSDILNGLG